MAIGPGSAERSLLNYADAIHIPVVIVIDRTNLTTRMFEKLIGVAEQVALDTDMRLLEGANYTFPSLKDDAFHALWLQQNRFVITSVSRGSIFVEGVVLLGIVWAMKHFVAPGWEKSGTKDNWDAWVASTIDKASAMIIENFSGAREGLQRLKIRKIVKKKDFEAETMLEHKSGMPQVKGEKHLRMLPKPIRRGGN